MFQFDNVKSGSERRPIGAAAALANRYQCIMNRFYENLFIKGHTSPPLGLRFKISIVQDVLECKDYFMNSFENITCVQMAL